MKLRSPAAYWDPDKPAVIEALKKQPADMPRDELELVVSELDRRFMQLWDKVQFENRTRDK